MKRFSFLCFFMIVLGLPAKAQMIARISKCDNPTFPFGNCEADFSWLSDTCTANGALMPLSPSTCTYTWSIDFSGNQNYNQNQINTFVDKSTAVLAGYEANYGLVLSSYTNVLQNTWNTRCSGKPCQ